ncbi:hypothetical protein MGAD_02360 [Mycolicibacterium gadium]|uniref:Uncharacterized protein n=1 Tax=Mycolicibacterium gadium TaxID=1794 RepID=A0A7I7WH86_MYCGU|nr:hypothetical protein MGAD_02360 [Mycolicibacterium gadium]
MLAALVVAPVARAEPGVQTQADEGFYRSLREGAEGIAGMVLTSPPLVRQRMDDGVDKLDAIDILMAEGPYDFDAASNIVARPVVYCSEHLGIT